MNKELRHMTLVLSCLFAITLTSSASVTYYQQNTEQALPFSYLTLTTATPKEEYLLLEPIPITLTVSNETQRPILGHTALEFTNKFVELLVTKESGETRKAHDQSVFSILSPREPTRLIAPGERHQVDQTLLLHLGEDFPRAGTYKIQAVLKDVLGNEQIQSNFITIRIVEPRGRDRAALQYIAASRNASNFFTGVGFSNSEESRRVWEDFVASFGESQYGDHAAFKLGEFYFARRDYVKALRHFDKLSKKDRFVFVERVREYLKKIRDKDKQ